MTYTREQTCSESQIQIKSNGIDLMIRNWWGIGLTIVMTNFYIWWLCCCDDNCIKWDISIGFCSAYHLWMSIFPNVITSIHIAHAHKSIISNPIIFWYFICHSFAVTLLLFVFVFVSIQWARIFSVSIFIAYDNFSTKFHRHHFWIVQLTLI